MGNAVALERSQLPQSAKNKFVSDEVLRLGEIFGRTAFLELEKHT